MKTVIDQLSSETESEWSADSGVTIGINEESGAVAGYNDDSFMVTFAEGSEGAGIERSISEVDVSEYDQLVVSAWSRRLARGIYRTFSECPYRVVINGDEVFGLRVWKGLFETDTFDISDIDSIDSIRIEAATGEDDTLVVSYMVASKDEMPYDVFAGVKEAIENVRDNDLPSGKHIGNVSGSAGDEAVDIHGLLEYVWRYAVIRIADSENEEVHHLSETTRDGITFTSLFDGEKLKHDYDGADVYLEFPVNIYQTEKEVMLPGITLYGMEAAPHEWASEVETWFESFRPDEATEVNGEHATVWSVNVDISARALGLNATMAQWVRKTAQGRNVWINGRMHYLVWEEGATEELPLEAVASIPGLSYTIQVETKEPVWKRKLPIAQTANLSTKVRRARTL